MKTAEQLCDEWLETLNKSEETASALEIRERRRSFICGMFCFCTVVRELGGMDKDAGVFELERYMAEFEHFLTVKIPAGEA